MESTGSVADFDVELNASVDANTVKSVVSPFVEVKIADFVTAALFVSVRRFPPLGCAAGIAEGSC